MRIVKLTLLVLITFAVAWMIFSTFNQPLFQIKAPLKFLVWKTPELTLYWYPLGAFVAGLLIGLAIAVNTFFSMHHRLSSAHRELRRREKEQAVPLPASAEPFPPGPGAISASADAGAGQASSQRQDPPQKGHDAPAH